MEQKIICGDWDPYTYSYNYDEVKVICMLHNRLIEMGRYPDWEDIMKVGHEIWKIYRSQLGKTKPELERDWMEIESHEEFAYVQAWFGRNIDDFIKYFKKWLHIYC